MFLELILLLITSILVVKFFLISSKPPGTPPGPNGYPIIGVLPPKNMTFEKFIQKYREKYGDIFWIKMGSDNYVFVCNYEDIVAAFSNPALQGRPKQYSLLQAFKCGLKKSQSKKSVDHILGIVNNEGESWKNTRRFVIKSLRDGGMGKSTMESFILREAEALVDDLENYVGKPTEIPWSVNASILNAVWGIVGDRRYPIYDKKIQHLFYNINDGIRIMQDSLFIFDRLPWLTECLPEFIMDFFGRKEFLNKIDDVYTQINEVIEDHFKTIDVDNPRDLIDSYIVDLKNAENGTSGRNDSTHTFSREDLIQTIFDLFVAGSETTSSAAKWFLLFMAKYPKVQKKLQEELDMVVPKDRMFSLTDRVKLPYLEGCINEALRLKSILPFGLFHAATEDTKIGKYLIPKGTSILANLISCHRDPRYWKNPHEFYPEHFLKDDGTFDGKREGMIAFSSGRRVCLGENLARMDLYLILGTLLQKFSFSKPEGETLSGEVRSDQPFFTLPQPFKIIITKRN